MATAFIVDACFDKSILARAFWEKMVLVPGLKLDLIEQSILR